MRESSPKKKKDQVRAAASCGLGDEERAVDDARRAGRRRAGRRPAGRIAPQVAACRKSARAKASPPNVVRALVKCAHDPQKAGRNRPASANFFFFFFLGGGGGGKKKGGGGGGGGGGGKKKKSATRSSARSVSGFPAVAAPRPRSTRSARTRLARGTGSGSRSAASKEVGEHLVQLPHDGQDRIHRTGRWLARLGGAPRPRRRSPARPADPRRSSRR